MNALFSAFGKTLVASVALACAGAASAGPVIGFRPGSGPFVSTDLFTDTTDSGVSIGRNFAVGTVSDFVTQTTVARMSLNGLNVSPLGLGFNGAGGFEVSKVARITEELLSFSSTPMTPTSPSTQTVTFGMPTLAPQTTDVDPTTAGRQQLAFFYDPLGDGSVADPTIVRCYGEGPGYVFGSGCTSPDGILIASASLISNASSFTAITSGMQAGTGTGSFDLGFRFDFVNPVYLNFAVGTTERFTGTLSVPPFYNPAVMFDGTPSSSGILFRIDSSENFFTNAVPEPDGIALAGLALAMLSLTSLRRRNR